MLIKITKKHKIIFLSLGLFFLGSFTALAASSDIRLNLNIFSDTFGIIERVAPEGRVGADGTNWDTTYYLTVRTANDSDNVILYTSPALSVTDNAGINTNPELFTGVSPDIYDITIKGHQHLTKKLNDIGLAGGNNLLNFTQPDNSTPTGTIRLLAGDISGAGTDPSTLGDDVINSIDLNVMLGVLDADDLTGNGIRANLNQDVVINSVDLSILLDNLDKEGDR